MVIDEKEELQVKVYGNIDIIRILHYITKMVPDASLLSIQYNIYV